MLGESIRYISLPVNSRGIAEIPYKTYSASRTKKFITIKIEGFWAMVLLALIIDFHIEGIA